MAVLWPVRLPRTSDRDITFQVPTWVDRLRYSLGDIRSVDDTSAPLARRMPPSWPEGFAPPPSCTAPPYARRQRWGYSHGADSGMFLLGFTNVFVCSCRIFFCLSRNLIFGITGDLIFIFYIGDSLGFRDIRAYGESGFFSNLFVLSRFGQKFFSRASTV